MLNKRFIHREFPIIQFIIMGFAHAMPQLYLYNLKTDSRKTFWRSKHLLSFVRWWALSFPEMDQHLPPVRTRSWHTWFLSSLCGVCLCLFSAPSQSRSWVNLEPSLAFAELWLFIRNGVLGWVGKKRKREQCGKNYTGYWLSRNWTAGCGQSWQVTPAYDNSVWPSFGCWSVLSVRYVGVETAGEWNSNIGKAKGGGPKFWLGFLGHQSS